jgi:integrase/recombinase XerD
VPVSRLAQGDDLLIGTTSGRARNLRTGQPAAFRFNGKIRLADFQTLTAEPDVVTGVADLGEDSGHRVLRVVRKGARKAKIPLTPATVAALDSYLAAWAERAG